MGLIVETFADIGVTRLSRWIFNCYLIHDGGAGRPVVIDPGLPGVADDLLPVLNRLGFDLGSLAALCATHAHSDHVGGAPTLNSRANARVHLPEPSRAFLEGSTPRTPRPKAIARTWPTAFDQPFDARGLADAARGSRVAGYGTGAGMRWPNDLPVGFLADGEALPGAPEWTVIATPGHTDDSTSFWHPRTRTLLSGDAVLSVNGHAWITPETVDDAASDKSADRLRQLDVAHLLPGHGRPVHGDGVTAKAIDPQQGPRGVLAFSKGLLRCVSGRA
jgi:glyoxylase-like metal-dependent hydrolase (beta-lactamase superfamily II)